MYDAVCIDAWTNGESYIFFLIGEPKYEWSHNVYTPYNAEGLWGVSDNERVTLFHNRLQETELYSCSASEFDAFAASHRTSAPIRPNEFDSPADAAEYAADVFILKVNDIAEGVNEYTRTYSGTVSEVFKTGDDYSEGRDISVLGPYLENIESGGDILIMYETTERGSRFMFSYEYSFTANTGHIEAIRKAYTHLIL